MMSSHYHFAIFLVIFVATATAVYASCQKDGNLITCELDVDELDMKNYQEFLEKVRTSMAARFIENIPGLPPQTPGKPPPQWLDLKLKARAEDKDKETTLKIRGDNLYVIGYQTQNPQKWYEVSNKEGKHYIEGSEFLSFQSDYPDMLKAAGLKSITEVPLNKIEFIAAVKALADPKPEPSEEAPIAKAIILVAQMVSEACRFVYIADYFGTNLGKPATKLEEWMFYCLERKWKDFSVVLRCYDKYKAPKATATDPRSSLGVVLNTKLTECGEDCDDELPDVIDLHAHLHDVVKSATMTLFWRLLVLILCLVPVMLMIVRSLSRDR